MKDKHIGQEEVRKVVARKDWAKMDLESGNNKIKAMEEPFLAPERTPTPPPDPTMSFVDKFSQVFAGVFSCIGVVVNFSIGWMFEGEQVKAEKQLKIAIVVAVFFMFVEIFGGLLANSLAIVVDAAHIASDVLGYVISLFAIQLTKRPVDGYFTYGYRQAEVLGGAGSVLLVWLMSIGLFFGAIDRLMNPRQIDAGLMLLLSIIGLIVNFINMAVLSDSGHGHSHGQLTDVFGEAEGTSHGHSHDHGHGHSHGAKKPSKPAEEHSHGHSHGKKDESDHGHGHSECKEEGKGSHGHSHEAHGHSHDQESDHSHSHGSGKLNY